MILNRINYDNEKAKIKKSYKERSEAIKKEEEMEEEEEEDEDIEKEDNNKNKIIKKGLNVVKNNIKLLKDKIFYYKIFSTILVLVVSLIIILIIVKISKNDSKDLISLRGNQSNQTSEINETSTNNVENINENEINKIKEDLKNAYNNEKEINIIKFVDENINKKAYFTPELSKFTNIHISIGFIENDIDSIIIHLSSILQHSSQTSFIHLHMMDATSDNFSYETLIKLKKMIYKINNNTEIIVYNCAQCIKEFKMREDNSNRYIREYSKLCALKILKNIQKIIFLDGDDCMVEKDLSELYNLDMNNIYVRGIPEIPSLKYSYDWIEKYLPDKSHYINGGVVLINLELCQKDNFYDEAIKLNNEEFYTKTEEPAQDILNVLMRKKIEFFNLKYNKINYYENPDDKKDESKWYPWVSETLKLGEKNNHFYTKEELMEGDENPVIIHYSWDKQLGKRPKKYEEDKSFYAKLIELNNYN